MADNKNIDESAENLKDRIEVLQKEIHDYAKFQRFSLKEFKRSDTFKKYSSLSTFIPETNKSVGADVARLLMGRFKEKRNIMPLRNEATGELIRDEQGNLKTVDKTDNSFRAQLKRSGLTSFGRYISDDKQGIFYDILRTAAGRFGDDFNGKKNTLSAYEKQISELSSQERNRENASTEASDGGEILTKIYENTEGIATALNVSNRKSEEFTEEIINLSKKNVDVGVKSLDAQTKKNATALEKELETKNTLEDVSVALKDIQKGVRNTVNLATKSVGGASGGSGDGGVLDNIADAASILSFGKGIFGKVGGAFGSIFGKVKGFGASTAGMLKHGAKVGTDKALPLLHTAKDSVKSVGAKVGENLNLIKDSAKKVLDKGKAVSANVLDKGKDALVSGKAAVNNIPMPKLTSFANKAGIIGAGITATTAIYDINEASDKIDEKVKSGVISKEDANRAKTNSAIEIGSRATGSAVGGLGGMKAGAALGATLGTVVPGLGTGVGAILGGLLGAFAGERIGNWLGGTIGDSATDDVKEKKSFEERYAELEERREKVSSVDEYRKKSLLTHEKFQKKLAELEKIGALKRIGVNENGTIIYDQPKLVNEAYYEASEEAQKERKRQRDEFYKDEKAFEAELREANPELYKSFYSGGWSAVGGGGTNIDGYSISPSKKNKEGDNGKASDNTPPKKDTGKNSTPKTESKKEGAKENKPKIEPKKDEVKEKGSFEERLKGINESYKKISDSDENKRRVGDELYTKKIAELVKSGDIKPLGKDEDGNIIYDNQELVNKARQDATKEAPKELRRQQRQLKEDENNLLKEIAKDDIKLFNRIWGEKNRKADESLYYDGNGAKPIVSPNNTIKAKEPLSTLTSNNISPSNKNQEGDKMVNESDRANFNEKQRQAESGKTSENVINNVHQTNVNNQTVQNRQLKPRSEQSINDRLLPWYY